MACPWCRGGSVTRWSRICRPCTPKILNSLAQVEEQRESYRSSMFHATDKVGHLDKQLTKATKLLKEAAAWMKRGRTARPLSERIVAFLDGPDEGEST